MKAFQKVPVPERLAKRPKDRRGYPIPWVNLIDAAGVPQFTINDHDKVIQCVSEQRCGLCGEKLDNGAWFVGGPMCFTERGAFVDPNMHEDCAKYALKVCPFLAIRPYSKRVDQHLAKRVKRAEGQAIVTLDMPPEQPALFGIGMVASYSVQQPSPGMLVFIQQSVEHRGKTLPKFLRLEWWRDGEQLDELQVKAVLFAAGLIDREGQGS